MIMSEDFSNDKLDKNSEITVKKSTFNKLLIGIIGVAIVSAFLGGYVVGSETVEPEKIIINEAKSNPEIKPSSGNQQSQPSIILVSLDDDPVKGNPNAPITIVEFSDYQCPFCSKFHSQTLPLIEENYIKTGKVKFVYRDFPIQSIHPNAVPAALASECADDQGMFWQYHDLLFVNQKRWEGLQIPDAMNLFKDFAVSLGLDTDSFNSCFETAKYSSEVNNDLQDGRLYGVTGTPGFFVGNEKIGYIAVQGAQPYSVFERLLDQLEGL